MNKVNIFVSSTCYDLSQVRTNLYEAISNLGFTPILSEFPTFPINPANNIVENCIQAVNESADIFVLILGSRYGYQLESGKSITNIEFITAKNKNIPIYVFIKKQIINLLPIYLSNKSADYSSVVDNSAIFEFASDVRNNSGLWSFEFDNFQDIIMILKIQLSYLFKEALSLRNKFYKTENHNFHIKLTNRALKIIFLKEAIYEYEYMAQVFVDEINKYELLKKDYEYKVVLRSNGRIMDNIEFLQWASNKITGTKSFITTLMNIVHILLPKYLNEPGEPADLKGLYYVANTYARVYEAFINWTVEILSVEVKDIQIELRDIISDFTSEAIETIWNVPFKLYDDILEAKRKIQMGESNVSVKMDIVLKVDPEVMERYNKAIKKFEKHMSQ